MTNRLLRDPEARLLERIGSNAQILQMKAFYTLMYDYINQQRLLHPEWFEGQFRIEQSSVDPLTQLKNRNKQQRQRGGSVINESFTDLSDLTKSSASLDQSRRKSSGFSHFNTPTLGSVNTPSIDPDTMTNLQLNNSTASNTTTTTTASNLSSRDVSTNSVTKSTSKRKFCKICKHDNCSLHKLTSFGRSSTSTATYNESKDKSHKSNKSHSRSNTRAPKFPFPSLVTLNDSITILCDYLGIEPTHGLISGNNKLISDKRRKTDEAIYNSVYFNNANYNWNEMYSITLYHRAIDCSHKIINEAAFSRVYHIDIRHSKYLT